MGQRLVIRVYRSLVVSLSAWKAAGLGDWALASLKLDELSRIAAKPIPSGEVPLELNILALQIAYFRANEKDALAAASVCVDMSQRQRTDGDRYLGHFIAKCLTACRLRFPDLDTDYLELQGRLPLHPFNEARVSSTLRMRAPL